MLKISGDKGILDLKKLNNAVLMALEVVYLNALIENTPHRTGYLSTQWELHSLGDFTYLFTNPEGDIVKALEYGRPAQIIEAKNKKFMRFKIPTSRVSPKHGPLPGNIAFEKDGYVFTKKILHPGFEAMKFVESTFTDKTLEKKFEEKLTTFIKRTMK